MTSRANDVGLQRQAKAKSEDAGNYLMLNTVPRASLSKWWIMSTFSSSIHGALDCIMTITSHNMPRPSPPSVGAEAPRAAEPTAPADGNVAVGSHAQYVPTFTAAAA